MKNVVTIHVPFEEFFEMREIDSPKFGKIKVGTSFYDVPDRLDIVVVPGRVDINVRYISDGDADKLLDGDGAVRLRYGKHSGRVYKILIDTSAGVNIATVLGSIGSGCDKLTGMFPRRHVDDDPVQSGDVLGKVLKRYESEINDALRSSMER